METRVLFVDLGGVIVVNKAKEVGEKYEKLFGLTPEMTRKVFRYLHASPRTEDQLRNYLNDENIKPELWLRFTTELYSSEQRNDGLIDLLFQAKHNGILIVFTTNNANIKKGIKKYYLDNLADLVINSSDYLVAKPDRKYWEVAFSETKKLIPDISKNEVLVIDDSKTNCLSATEFGLKSFVYKNIQESNQELQALVLP